MNDQDLLDARSFHSRLGVLLRTELSSLGAFLVALAEFDRRRLFRDLGHASLFDYLHRGLRLSRGAARYRRAGAWLVQRVPDVLEPIQDGRLCFSTVAVVPARTVVTQTGITGEFSRKVHLGESESTARGSQPQAEPLLARGQLGTPNAAMAPVMPTTESRIHMTVSREFLALLENARAGESHRNPGATDEEVLKLALESLIEKQEKRRASVPPKVKREVRKRDGGKCTWPRRVPLRETRPAAPG